MAAQVFGLMQNHLFELCRREPGEEPVGNQNPRREEADDAGAVKMARGADFDGPARGSFDGQQAAILDRRGGLPQLAQTERVKAESGGAENGCSEPQRGNRERPSGCLIETRVSLRLPKRSRGCDLRTCVAPCASNGRKGRQTTDREARCPGGEAMRGGDAGRECEGKGPR